MEAAPQMRKTVSALITYFRDVPAEPQKEMFIKQKFLIG
jgi:hypothetical protein